MWVHRGAVGIEARAPAKLNLRFEVLGKRDDGYHEIETLMVPVNLYDSLNFQVTPPSPDGPGPISVDCRWAAVAGGPPLPQGPPNLAYRAIELLRRRAGVEQGGCVTLIKRIPVQAGLGGGSSDAAAALVVANLGWQLGWRRAQLAAVAAELGSDVPFFLYGGAAICRGRGELVEPTGPLGPLHGVIVQPPVGLSTADVYARCRPEKVAGSAEPLCDGMRRGALEVVGMELHNGLQSAAAALTPWVDRLAREFRRVGCPAHQLTGSGSAYFGLFHTAACARRAAARLRGRSMERVYVVQGAGESFAQAL